MRKNTFRTRIVGVVFHKGDEVELVEGAYQGTLGVFIGLRDDPAWADIAERNGAIRSHRIAWLVRTLVAGQ